MPRPGSAPLTIVARALKSKFTGRVSKRALATRWLPLSAASFFGTLIAAGLVFPPGYDWRVRVMSNLTSPRHNPEGYWLPALGIMAAMMLALPFAGYVARRLQSITPRLAWSAGLAFASGFGLLWFAVVAQFAEPVIGLRSLHQLLAGAAGLFFVVGMICCCACVLRDRLRFFGGQTALPGALAAYWLSLTLVPASCMAGIGILMLLGHQAGVVWAEDFRQSFRHTMLWQLAFWEWIGAIVAFAFLTGSALLLPAASGEWRKP